MILISIKMWVSTGEMAACLDKQSQLRTNAFSGLSQACIVPYKLMAWLFGGNNMIHVDRHSQAGLDPIIDKRNKNRQELQETPTSACR